MASVVSISSKAHASLHGVQSICMSKVAEGTTRTTGVQHLPAMCALCIALKGVLYVVLMIQHDYFCAGFQQEDAVHLEETSVYTAGCNHGFLLPLHMCKFFACVHRCTLCM